MTYELYNNLNKKIITHEDAKKIFSFKESYFNNINEVQFIMTAPITGSSVYLFARYIKGENEMLELLMQDNFGDGQPCWVELISYNLDKNKKI